MLRRAAPAREVGETWIAEGREVLGERRGADPRREGVARGD
jgi:hypothetical protein